MFCRWIGSLGREWSPVTEAVRLVWFSALLVYLGIIFVIPGGLEGADALFFLPFFLFIPGYASMMILAPQYSKQDTILLSSAVSLALFAGIDIMLKTLGIGYPISEWNLLVTFSSVIILIRLVTSIREALRKKHYQENRRESS